MGETWIVLLPDVDDDALLRAAHAHAAASEWWPTPAELRRAATPPEPDRAATWDAIIRRIAGGRYDVGDMLDAREMRALDAIGGTWAVRMADTDTALPRLRRRWLAALSGPTTDTRAIDTRATFRPLLGGKGGDQ